jgi:DNA-binding transcriptional LysR family regulator
MRRTPLAETLISPVSEILASIEQTIGTATGFDPQSDARTFRLVATDYTLLVLIRPALQRLAASGPHVRLQVRTTGFIEHAALLQRGEIDLAIVPEPLSRRALPQQPILDDRFVGVIWRGNTEVSDRLTIEQLHQLPYLSYRFAQFDSMAHRPLHELGFDRAPDIILESFALGAQMIRGTRHVTILQERLAKLYADNEELRLVEPPFPTPPLTETMTWHQRATHDPAHRWLRKLIQDVAASL